MRRLKSLRIEVEGWRFINHSYAVVNRNQLRWMLQDPRLVVTHKEMPLYSQAWQNKPVQDFPAYFADALALQQSPEPELLDWTLRLDFPSRLEKPRHGRLLIFATNEYQIIDAAKYVGRPIDEAFKDPETFFLTTSAWSAKAFYEQGVPPERVWVVPLGVDPEDFRRSDPAERESYRRLAKLADDEHLFLHIGAGTFNKGLDVLLMAFAAHCKRHSGTRLVVKGHDSLYGNAIYNAIQSPIFKLPAHVPFPKDRLIYVGGDLAPIQIDRMYRLADSYVSPYRAEGFNMPALEALVHGLPLAVTQGGSTDDFVGAFDHVDLVPGSASRLPDERRYIEPDVVQVLGLMNSLPSRPAVDPGALERSSQRGLKKFTWQAIVDSIVMRLMTA